MKETKDDRKDVQEMQAIDEESVFPNIQKLNIRDDFNNTEQNIAEERFEEFQIVMEFLAQQNDVFLQLKKRMDEYNSDFEGAVRRSVEIDEDDRLRAEQEIINWEILERFGMI